MIRFGNRGKCSPEPTADEFRRYRNDPRLVALVALVGRVAALAGATCYARHATLTVDPHPLVRQTRGTRDPYGEARGYWPDNAARLN